MINPDFSGFLNGFTIEVLDGDSSIVLEKVDFPGNVEILPGELTAIY